MRFALIFLLLAVQSQAAIGLDNHNPGNIRSTHPWQWPGAVGVDPWHRLIFRTDLDGLRAMRRVLRAYNRKGINTVAGIVNRWIGPKTGRASIRQAWGYLLRVAADMGTTGRIALNDPEVQGRLAQSIVYAENGSQPYPEALFKRVFHY